jgi:hypothetical protein
MSATSLPEPAFSAVPFEGTVVSLVRFLTKGPRYVTLRLGSDLRVVVDLNNSGMPVAVLTGGTIGPGEAASWVDLEAQLTLWQRGMYRGWGGIPVSLS